MFISPVVIFLFFIGNENFCVSSSPDSRRDADYRECIERELRKNGYDVSGGDRYIYAKFSSLCRSLTEGHDAHTPSPRENQNFIHPIHESELVPQNRTVSQSDHLIRREWDRRRLKEIDFSNQQRRNGSDLPHRWSDAVGFARVPESNFVEVFVTAAPKVTLPPVERLHYIEKRDSETTKGTSLPVPGHDATTGTGSDDSTTASGGSTAKKKKGAKKGAKGKKGKKKGKKKAAKRRKKPEVAVEESDPSAVADSASLALEDSVQEPDPSAAKIKDFSVLAETGTQNSERQVPVIEDVHMEFVSPQDSGRPIPPADDVHVDFVDPPNSRRKRGKKNILESYSPNSRRNTQYRKCLERELKKGYYESSKDSYIYAKLSALCRSLTEGHEAHSPSPMNNEDFDSQTNQRELIIGSQSDHLTRQALKPDAAQRIASDLQYDAVGFAPYEEDNLVEGIVTPAPRVTLPTNSGRSKLDLKLLHYLQKRDSETTAEVSMPLPGLSGSTTSASKQTTAEDDEEEEDEELQQTFTQIVTQKLKVEDEDDEDDEDGGSTTGTEGGSGSTTESAESTTVHIGAKKDRGRRRAIELAQAESNDQKRRKRGNKDFSGSTSPYSRRDIEYRKCLERQLRKNGYNRNLRKRHFFAKGALTEC